MYFLVHVIFYMPLTGSLHMIYSKNVYPTAFVPIRNPFNIN